MHRADRLAPPSTVAHGWIALTREHAVDTVRINLVREPA
jgi:hypothetical protein